MNEHELERMIVRLVGDSSSYNRMLSDAKASTEAFGGHIGIMSQRVSAFGMQMRGYGMMAAAAIVPLIGLGGAMQNAFKGVKLAATAEENEVAFGVMLQSAEKGKQMVKDLQTFAAATPLNTEDLQRAAKMLLQFNVEGKNVMPIMKMLGDVTGGNAAKFQQMTYAFSTTMSAGKLMGNDLMQMINAGFNPLQVIAKQTGKSMKQLRDEMEAGKITVDKVVDAMRFATSEGGSMAGLMEKQSQTLSGLFSTMQDDIDSALREIGKDLIENLDLKGLIKDVSAAAQAFTDWFKSIDSGVKQAVFAFAGLIAIVIALTVAFFALKAVVTATFGGFNLVAAAVITALVGAAAAGAGLIASLGGIVGVWGVIKAKAKEAWDWLEPVRDALSSFWRTTKVVAIQTWEAFSAFVVSTWQRIVGDATINWDKIRAVIVETIQFGEFTLLNFEQVAKTAWAGIKYFAAASFNEILFFFTDILPAGVKYFVENYITLQVAAFEELKPSVAKFTVWFIDIHKEMFNAAVKLGENAIQAQLDMWRAVPELLRSGAKSVIGMFSGEDVGKGVQSDIAQSVINGHKEGFARLPKFELPKRQMGEMEKQWKAEWESMRGATQQSFDEFKKMKAEEFMGPELPGAVDAVNTKLDLAKQNMQGLKNEAKDANAALIGSADALSRITDYKASIDLTGKNLSASAGTSTTAGAVMRERMQAVGVNTADSKERETKQTNYLKDIKDATQALAKKDSVTVQPAGL